MSTRTKISKQILYQLPKNPKTYLYILLSTLASVLAIAFFLELANNAQHIFKKLNNSTSYLTLVLTPIAFALILYFDKKTTGFIGGSGIPQLIAATDSRNRELRLLLLSFKIAISKIFLVAFAVLAGASVSFGGPSVHVGGSIFYNFSHKIQIKKKLFINAIIAMGGSVGLIMAFNAPMAGFLFAFEEIGRNLKRQALILIAIVVFIAYFLGSFYHGNSPYFSDLNHSYFDLLDTWKLLPIILISSVLGAFFAKLALYLIKTFVFSKNTNVIIFAIICGLVVAVVNVINNNAAGSGENEILMLLSGEKLGYEFILAKFVASLASFASTIAGGLFMTSMSIGAAIGSELSSLYQQIDMQVLVLFGMISYLSAVIRTPLTAAFLVLEMTHSLELILPGVLIAYISGYVSKQISKTPIYEALAQNYLSQSKNTN